jgi:hypothetical protein
LTGAGVSTTNGRMLRAVIALHHKLNKANYGQFFTLCDRIFETYKAPDGIVYDGADRQPWNQGAAAPAAE